MARLGPVYCVILCLFAGGIARAQVPLPPEGPPPWLRWYKGNLHTHSLLSDGNDFPEMVADWYKAHDYDFLAITDHDTAGIQSRWIDVDEANRRLQADSLARCRERFGGDWPDVREEDGKRQVRIRPLNEYRGRLEESEKFLLLRGEEITDKANHRPIHINAIGLVDSIPPQGGARPSEAIAADFAVVAEQARRERREMFAFVNHPNFGYALRAEDLALVSKARHFELFNGHPDVHIQGDRVHPSTERLWDIANTLRLGELHAAPLFGLGTDDAHNYNGPHGPIPGRAWVYVRTHELSSNALIRALKFGDFYASTGVVLRRLRFDRAGRTLSLEIEPDGDAHFTTRFIGTMKNYDRARTPVEGVSGRPLPVTQRYSDDIGRELDVVEGLTASYQLRGDELYVRAVVTSDRAPEVPSHPKQLRKAWTQPHGWEPSPARPARNRDSKP